MKMDTTLIEMDYEDYVGDGMSHNQAIGKIAREWDMSHEEVDGAELNETMEDWSGWDTDDPDFEWWELTKAKNGEEYEPQEVIDEMVYGFFQDGKVEVRHD